MPDQGRPAPLSAEPGFAFCPGCGAPVDAPRPVTCATCGRTHWRNAKPCAGALVVRDGRLLLVRRAGDPFAGFWDIPGGFCEPTELPAAAAVREVFEETGIRVATTELLGMWIDRYDQGGVVQDTLNVYFLARPIEPIAPRLDPREVSAIEWFSPDDLPERVAFPDHASAVLDAWSASAGA